MKKYIYTLLAALLIISCKDSNENLVQERGVAVVPAMSKPSPAYFTDNLNASYVQFNVSLAQGDAVDKAEIEVNNGKTSAIVKEITLPATGVKVTASEVLNALKIPVSNYKTGDSFSLYVLTTKDGQTTRSKAAFVIPVVCYFDPSMLVGKFDFVSEDWGEEGTVNLVADPANPYKIYIEGYPQVVGLTGNGNRIVLNVDPDDFSVSGPKVIIANDLSELGVPNQDYSFTPVAGTYSACDDVYTITYNLTLSLWGNQGNFEFVYTRAK